MQLTSLTPYTSFRRRFGGDEISGFTVFCEADLHALGLRRSREIGLHPDPWGAIPHCWRGSQKSPAQVIIAAGRRSFGSSIFWASLPTIPIFLHSAAIYLHSSMPPFQVLCSARSWSSAPPGPEFFS